MATLLFHVDAFTRVPFRGNPAAVVILDALKDEDWMQSFAREMNVSETAFAFPLSTTSDQFTLRWFTPAVEVPLCGHATLATAHVLLEEGVVQGGVTFSTASGELRVEKFGDAGGLALSLPSFDTEPATCPELVASLGAEASDVRFSVGAKKLLVRVASEQELLEMSPDIDAMMTAPNPLGVRGVIVTAAMREALGGASPHFVSRYFAPWVGIGEDPVTGAAHAVLGPYWSARLGRKKFLAAQRSPRGGEMGVEVKAESVVLTGSCVTISRGMLRI